MLLPVEAQPLLAVLLPHFTQPTAARFAVLMAAAVLTTGRRIRIGRVLGDAAYDAEHNHALCRNRLGIPESIFQLNPRNTGRKWPQAP